MASSIPGARFAEYLAARKPQIEAALSSHTPQATQASNAVASDLATYLYEPYARLASSGGKRVRSALCLLGAEAVGSDPMAALTCAAAVETFQNAALIHDDIADHSVMRRGAPCLHVSEGEGQAIVIGDLGVVHSFDLLIGDLDLEAELCLALLDELVVMEHYTSEGQALDIAWARDSRWDISEQDYLAMATLKTAYYSASTPLAMGARVGGGDDNQIEALRAFGLDAGLAFQIADDLLNLEGDAEAQGKDYRSDITEGKRTLVAVYALAHAGEHRDELLGLLSSGTTNPADLARAVELFDQTGALAYAHEMASDLSTRAQTRLFGVELVPNCKDILLSMADYFVGRTA